MKSYAEASRFPLIEIGGIPVPRLILGHLPFVGESYQGPEKNRECLKKFSDVENTIKILTKAVKSYGITVMGATPATEGKLAGFLLEAIRETIRRTATEIALIPCLQIPLTVMDEPLDDYKRWLTYYYIEGQLAGEKVLKKYIEDPILLCREGWKEKFSRALAHQSPYQGEILRELQIDYDKLSQAIASLQGFNVLFIEPGSETDFLAMTGRLDLLSKLVDWLRNNYGYRILFGTHHAGTTIPILKRSRIDFGGYITPFNKLGVMMFPTQEIVIKAMKSSKKPMIAIKPLAGGRIPPNKALEFVFKNSIIDACMIGVASESELDEDITLAGQSFSARLALNFTPL